MADETDVHPKIDKDSPQLKEQVKIDPVTGVLQNLNPAQMPSPQPGGNPVQQPAPTPQQPQPQPVPQPQPQPAPQPDGGQK